MSSARPVRLVFGMLLSFLAAIHRQSEGASFINFETATVHPIALSPNGRVLAVCNLPDYRVELLDVSSGLPKKIGDVPVGVDPVSVRFRTTNELWVVNAIGDSISIIDLASRGVVATLDTLSGPADVVFGGDPSRAFVSCAKADAVQIFDPVTRAVLTQIPIDGDRPKALAVSPDGARIYVAIFESGNASTILVGDALRHQAGPYGGMFPPPNDGLALDPPLHLNPDVDPVLYTNSMPQSLIVKKNSAGRWMDDNHGDWTEFISGTNSTLPGRSAAADGPSAHSARPRGWDMPDRDLAIIDTGTLEVSYATGLMNVCMDLAVNPASGQVALIGTDATNERRFEPNLRGRFLRVNLALVDPVSWGKTIVDLNPHLDYSGAQVLPLRRDLSLGDPRGIVWNAAGTQAYVIGMGSRNLVVLDAAGRRLNLPPVELGDGPAGLALDEVHRRLYVFNRFSDTLTALDTETWNVLTNVVFFDPTPAVVRAGRKHFYDTRSHSGPGHLACASCHVDARFDRLAWDLGNPAADTLTPAGVTSSAVQFHPMKGPLVTQTLQDVVSAPQLHWRGDRRTLDEFNVTFVNLLGADSELTACEMEELKAFLATIHFPPNRYRNFDNSLPEDLPIPEAFRVQETSISLPLPNGNAVRGRDLFIRCAVCHQSGGGLNFQTDDNVAVRHGLQFKIAQLRSIPDKLGFSVSGTTSRAGFGFRFDGRDESFLDTGLVESSDVQSTADLVAFLLAFTGGQLPLFDFGTRIPSQDSPAALGRQLTLVSAESNHLSFAMVALADVPSNRVDLIVRGALEGRRRGWFYDRNSGRFQSDRNQEELSVGALLSLAQPGNELIFTLVPLGSGRRVSIDRDEDGYFDRTEEDIGSDPVDRGSFRGNAPPKFLGLPRVAVHPGMTISTEFAVADPDLPLQSWSVAPIDPLPAGAQLDSQSGRFNWTPREEWGGRTYRIRVRVTDNGVPALYDSGSFEIRVVPLRADFSPDFWMHWDGVPGVTYRREYKNNLNDPEWRELTSGFFGGEGEDRWGGPVGQPTEPQRIYRVIALPSPSATGGGNGRQNGP